MRADEAQVRQAITVTIGQLWKGMNIEEKISNKTIVDLFAQNLDRQSNGRPLIRRGNESNR